MIGYYIYLLISPFIWTLAFLLMFLFPKMRERSAAWLGVYKAGLKKLKAYNHRPILMFHAASSGEFEQLKPLLDRMDRTQYTVVVTFFSATVYRREKQSGLFDVCFYHPLDSVWSAYFFFKNIKPVAYIVNRHDLWPAHLWVAKKLGVRTFYINANVHEGSKRNIGWLKSFNAMLLGQFDLILTGSERLKRHIQAIGEKLPVEITGDSRFDQVYNRMLTNQRQHFTGNPRKTIVLGSVVPSDYPVVLGGLRAYWGNKNGQQMGQQLILVPHEVADKDIQEAIKHIEKQGFSWSRYSVNKELGTTDVLIVDVVGILAELYGYGYCTYVGAGFGAGVHSVIEPAVYAIPVAYGPNISLLDEAVEMADLGVGHLIYNQADFTRFLTQSEILDKKQYEISKQFIESKKGASDRILSQLLNRINAL